MDPIFIYLLSGAAAGLLAGLFGAGGGVVTVPALHFLFIVKGFGPEHSMHMAIATSMAFMIVNASFAALFHHRRHNVQWPVFRRMYLMVLLGATLGGGLAGFFHGLVLRNLFACFTLFAALYVFFNLFQWRYQSLTPRKLSPKTDAFVGLFVGTVSSILGVGGSIITVPYFLWCRLQMRQAVGTAAACTPVIAVFGTSMYILTGYFGASPLPKYALGYVFLPALMGLLSAGILCSYLGVKIAHKLPSRFVKGLYVCLLLFISFTMFHL